MTILTLDSSVLEALQAIADRYESGDITQRDYKAGRTATRNLLLEKQISLKPAMETVLKAEDGNDRYTAQTIEKYGLGAKKVLTLWAVYQRLLEGNIL